MSEKQLCEINDGIIRLLQTKRWDINRSYTKDECCVSFISVSPSYYMSLKIFAFSFTHDEVKYVGAIRNKNKFFFVCRMGVIC